MQKTIKLAVLIDADNAQASTANDLLSEVSRYGTANVKRIYGDWTTDRLRGWKDVLNRHAIVPIQQFAYTSGKNATDSALIIDAMDLLHTGNLDGFCLVSSDSDFTKLATRIRESGLLVYGFGEKKTPQAFVAACDKFVFTEVLRSSQITAPAAAPRVGETPAKSVSEAKTPDLSKDKELMQQVIAALAATTADDGWATLAMVGDYLTKNNPSFDARNYGCSKLGSLMKKLSYVEVKEMPKGHDSPVLHLYVRAVKKVAKGTGK